MRSTDLATGAIRVLGTQSASEPRVTDPTKIGPANPHGIRSLTISPDGGTVVAANEDGALAVWDARTGAHRTDWLGHTTRARKVVFAADGRTAFSVGDTTVREWDVATGRETARATLSGTGWDVGLFDGDRMVAAVTDGRELSRWRASDLTSAGKPQVGSLRDALVVENQLLVASPSSLHLVDGDGREHAEVSQNSPHFATATARWVLVASADLELVLFDPSLTPVRRWQPGHSITLARFRPDGAVLATVDDDNKIELWDPRTGSLLVESPRIPTLVTQLAWSPDGRSLAIAGYAGTVWVWDLSPMDPAGLRAFVDCVSPWQRTADDVALVARPFDPTSCALLQR